ncbi:MAG: RIP metalloprotease RseP [bacterium]
MLSTIIIFILILGLLVFVHEFGHFIAAKKMGVRVEEFAIGFPPRIWSRIKHGTKYSINWIPIGGFVKLKGEDTCRRQGSEKKDEDSFAHKKIWQKCIILASGVGMNFLLAAIVLSFGFMIGAPQMVEGNHGRYAKIRDEKIQIVNVLKDSPAEKVGIMAGDIIKSIDGMDFIDVKDIQEYINEHGKEKMIFETIRGDENIKRELEAQYLQDKKKEEEEWQEYIVGVSLAKVATISYPFHIAIYKGVETTFFLTKEILAAVYGIIDGLLKARKISVDFAGPVGIATMTGQVADLGFIYVLQFIALLSINLGIINLMPFPALDGGRIFFLFLEKIMGKAVDEKIEAMIHNIGFLLLMLLIVVITYKDILNNKSMFIDFFRNIF